MLDYRRTHTTCTQVAPLYRVAPNIMTSEGTKQKRKEIATELYPVE